MKVEYSVANFDRYLQQQLSAPDSCLGQSRPGSVNRHADDSSLLFAMGQPPTCTICGADPQVMFAELLKG